MKFYLISDATDSKMGMRLAGVRGEVLHEKDEVEAALDRIIEDDTIAVVMMTENLVKLCRDKVYDIKLNRKRPLIVEIPDRHSNGNVAGNISNYIKDAIGMKI